MGFFRNPEIKRSFILYIFLSVAIVLLSFVFDNNSWLFSLAICVIFGLFHFITTYIRYKKLKNLSLDIDKILHGNYELNLKDYAEGELAVLHNEINKMTARLNEQAENLKKDKIYLADSIADISHQIRTPLTSINLIASFLSEENLSDDRRLELTKELFSLLSKIEWLINSLLKISKLDAGTIKFNNEQVNLYSLIKKSALPIEIPLDLKNQKLVINSNKQEAFYGDINWTIEAVENILKNCMEHTDEGGTITVTLLETPIFSEIVISDNGKGIDENDLPNLFKRFYKGKNSSSSSIGIGLALAKMIIISQNGTIKAENNEDKGAKFTIKFYKTTVWKNALTGKIRSKRFLF